VLCSVVKLQHSTCILAPRPMSLPVRNAIKTMAGYAPGEQPQDSGWIKLNTNENPYPPSPAVVEAIQVAATSRLNVYPDATSTPFRIAAADLFDLDPDWILPANGSDENLTIIIRTVCDAGDLISYPYPSYVLYEELARIQDCPVEHLPLNQAWVWEADRVAQLRQQTRLFFVPNPNSPTGNVWDSHALVQLLPENGMLVLDEAYADFMDTPHRGELLHDERFGQRLIMTRTLSKSYSLAGLRFGFSIAHPDVTSQMLKVKDSYNCDAIAIAAATAAIKDQKWMLANRDRILKTRNRLAGLLPDLGFTVHDSEANFIWTQHVSRKHKAIYEQLKERRILVRYMHFPDAGDDGQGVEGLRITIGTDEEIDQFIEVLRDCVS